MLCSFWYVRVPNHCAMVAALCGFTRSMNSKVQYVNLSMTLRPMDRSRWCEYEFSPFSLDPMASTPGE